MPVRGNLLYGEGEVLTMKEKLVPFEHQRFECLQCGECCRSRNVPVTMEDIKRLSKFRDPKEFLIIFDERKLVLERREWDSGCVFLDDTRCTVQEIKPLVCQLYPVCVSDKPLLEEGEPVRLKDGADMYVYVDCSCKGVGRGDQVDLEGVREKVFLLRTEMFATDLGALVGWYIENEKDY